MIRKFILFLFCLLIVLSLGKNTNNQVLIREKRQTGKLTIIK